jgi:hypothetical protein
MNDPIPEPTRRLNHVEMIYRPGERDVARRVFELLGMRVVDRGGRWMLALADPAIAEGPTTRVTRRR